MIEKHHKGLIILFLELLSLSPIFLILGNIVPPFPIKVHFITFGLSFLLVSLFLLQYKTKKWLVYTSALYFILQFFLSGLDLKEFVDFFFGPFVFVTLVDVLFNNRIQKTVLNKYQKRFFTLMWIPVIIGFFQFLELFPFTFWNATYVNHTNIDGVDVARANGFLYHGSELSIIIFFIGVAQIFKPLKYFLPFATVLIILAYGTYYKALLATVVLLVFYYVLFLNPQGYFKKLPRIINNEKVIYSWLLVIVVAILSTLYYTVEFAEVKRVFKDQMLTGRGAIWNIYLQGVSDFSFFEFIFGNGIGSESELFKENVSKALYYPARVEPNTYVAPDAHNALFSLFLNSGISGILLVILIFKMVHTQVINWKPNKKLNQRIFFLIFIIPFLTLGITIPINKMAIYWISIGFILIRWYHHFQNSHE